MTKSRLEKIKQSVSDSKASADRIMDGGENYDGADGARKVQDLCDQVEELIQAIESSGILIVK